MIGYLIVPKDDQRPEAGWMTRGRLLVHTTRSGALGDMGSCFTRQQQSEKTVIRVRLEVDDGRQPEDQRPDQD